MIVLDTAVLVETDALVSADRAFAGIRARHVGRTRAPRRRGERGEARRPRDRPRRGRLPEVGTLGGGVSSGDRVTAVGYPLGGELRLTAGVVVDLVGGAAFGIPGRVIRLTAPVKPENSGGPLLDRAGKIVGVVFAKELATGPTLAISVATLTSLVRSGDLAPVPGCGLE